MIRSLAFVTLLALGGCAYDQYSSNQLCARSAGCVSGFATSGEGPIQAQAVAPVNAGALLPQR
jgi:hypothetical protein